MRASACSTCMHALLVLNAPMIPHIGQERKTPDKKLSLILSFFHGFFLAGKDSKRIAEQDRDDNECSEWKRQLGFREQWRSKFIRRLKIHVDARYFKRIFQVQECRIRVIVLQRQSIFIIAVSDDGKASLRDCFGNDRLGKPLFFIDDDWQLVFFCTKEIED